MSLPGFHTRQKIICFFFYYYFLGARVAAIFINLIDPNNSHVISGGDDMC